MDGEGGSAPAQESSTSSSWSDLRTRALSGVVMIALALGTAWAGGSTFIFLWAAAASVILIEWQGITSLKWPPSLRIANSILLMVVVVGAVISWGKTSFLLAFASGIVVWTFVIWRRAWDGAGPLCAVALLTSALSIRFSPSLGFQGILWLFAVVWATDIGAYFAGRALGGPKLWPAVSPKKTWSGALGGALAGALAGIALARWAGIGNLAALFAFGLVTSAVSQGGDLFESHLKRRFGVKDSSNLIPGHGGLLDRLDGFIAASAFAALVGWWRAGPEVATGMLQW